MSGKALAAGIAADPEPVASAIPLTYFSNGAKWRKLPACDRGICRKLEAYATQKSDGYFSNGVEDAIRELLQL